MTIAIGVNGACGRMGQRIIALASEDPSLRLAAALDMPGHPRQGQDAGTVAGVGPLGVAIGHELPLSTRLDVMIDIVGVMMPEKLIEAVEAGGEFLFRCLIGCGGQLIGGFLQLFLGRQ